jgi:hypothetical protein
VILIGSAFCISWLVRRKRAQAHQEVTTVAPQNLASRENKMLLIYAIVFILAMNGIMAVLDGANIIPVFFMKAYRYVLVCLVSYAIVVAIVVERFEALLQNVYPTTWRLRGILSLRGLLGLALLLGMEAYWNDQYSIRAVERHYLEELAIVVRKHNYEVICDASPYVHPLAFYMATRTRIERVKYVLPDEYPVRKLLVQAQKYYPSPLYITPQALSQTTNAYLLLKGDLQAMLVNSTNAIPRANTTDRRTP